MTDRAAARARLRPAIERARGFSGWDLSGAPGRHLDPGPPWEYESLVCEHAHHAASVLDVGTGGGEVLDRLRACLPEQVVATEEWSVNVTVALHRLSPRGVGVVRCWWAELPFAENSFDMVLDRHEALEPAEMSRVLRPGGHVITQQVGRSNWRELRRFFPRMADFGDKFGDYTRGFIASGLSVIDAREHAYRVAYPLDALVYLLAIMPWSIPDFDLKGDLDALLALDAAHGTEDGIVLTESRFLIVAGKPA